MPREELRARVFPRAAPGAFEHVLDGLAARGELARVGGDGMALAAPRGAADAGGRPRARAALAEAARGAGWPASSPPRCRRARASAPALGERIARVLVAEGELRRWGTRWWTASAWTR